MIQAIYQRLEKFERVNESETAEALATCILDFADVSGLIQGRTRTFSAEMMVRGLGYYLAGDVPANVLTREFGIRQQAMYLKEYGDSILPEDLNILIQTYEFGNKTKE